MDPIKLKLKSETNLSPRNLFVSSRNLADLCRGVLNGARKRYPNGGPLVFRGGAAKGSVGGGLALAGPAGLPG